MERIDFNGTDISEVLNRLPEKTKEALPFGLVKLAPDGTILEYNMAEAEISGVRPQDVIGKNFFLDVAICTQRPEFYGRFREGIAKGVLNQLFDFVFDYQMAPTKVRVHMFSSFDSQGKKFVWLMVKRVGAVLPAQNVSAAPVVITAQAATAAAAVPAVEFAQTLQAMPNAPTLPAHITPEMMELMQKLFVMSNRKNEPATAAAGYAPFGKEVMLGADKAPELVPTTPAKQTDDTFGSILIDLDIR